MTTFWTKTAATVVFIAATLLLSACTQNKLIRDNVVEAKDIPKNGEAITKCLDEKPAPGRNCAKNISIEVTPEYTLFFVELDEQGRFFDRRQIEALQSYLSNQKKQIANSTNADGASIVTFVHGWRHNAEFDDTNVKEARKTLLSTYLAEGGKEGRKVVGVYLGWRGLSMSMGLNKNESRLRETLLGIWEWVSVWDRKNTAHNMATGSSREVFSLLRAFQEQANLGSHKKCTDDTIFQCKPVRLIIIGHSFGGLLVYTAVAGQLMDSVVKGMLVEPNKETCREPWLETAQGTDRNKPGSALVSSYADLIVLISPAVEGTRFEPLHQVINARAQKEAGEMGAFCPNQRPVLVTITAENDWATRGGFLFTRVVNSAFEDAHPIDPLFNALESAYLTDEERIASINTIGHVPRYRTHRVNGTTTKATAVSPSTDNVRFDTGNYCDQKVSGLEKSLQTCRCEDQSEKMLLRQRGQDRDMHPLVCRNAVEKINLEQMLSYQSKTDWLTGVAPSEHHRLTFCDGITLSRLNDYKSDWFKPSPDSAPELKVKHAPSTPVWNLYTQDNFVLNGHSGWQPSFTTFVQQLYLSLSLTSHDQDTLKELAKTATAEYNDNKCLSE